MRGANPQRAGSARSLRRSATPTEALLSRYLRDRQLGGFDFVRQEPIGPCYADFACRELRLIVELDGGQHADNVTDLRRDRELARLGYRVIRIWNSEVLGNRDGVLERILLSLGEQPLTPTLSPQAGRGS
jgi:very-short-patch-repair endonuclease